MFKQVKFLQTATVSDAVVVARGNEQFSVLAVIDRLQNDRWSCRISGKRVIDDIHITLVDVSYRAVNANRDDIRRKLETEFARFAVSVPRHSRITNKVDRAATE